MQTAVTSEFLEDDGGDCCWAGGREEGGEVENIS